MASIRTYFSRAAQVAIAAAALLAGEGCASSNYKSPGPIDAGMKSFEMRGEREVKWYRGWGISEVDGFPAWCRQRGGQATYQFGGLLGDPADPRPEMTGGDLVSNQFELVHTLLFPLTRGGAALQDAGRNYETGKRAELIYAPAFDAQMSRGQRVVTTIGDVLVGFGHEGASGISLRDEMLLGVHTFNNITGYDEDNAGKLPYERTLGDLDMPWNQATGIAVKTGAKWATLVGTSGILGDEGSGGPGQQPTDYKDPPFGGNPAATGGTSASGGSSGGTNFISGAGAAFGVSVVPGLDAAGRLEATNPAYTTATAQPKE